MKSSFNYDCDCVNFFSYALEDKHFVSDLLILAFPFTYFKLVDFDVHFITHLFKVLSPHFQECSFW